MTIEDIYHTLQEQGMISVQAVTPPTRPTPGQAIKFPRGRKNGIARRHLQRQNTLIKEDEAGNKTNTPFVPPTRYRITWDPEKVEHHLEGWEKKGYMKLKPERLKWTPFVLARTKAGGEVLQTEFGAGMGALSGIAETLDAVTLVNNQTPAPGTAEFSVNVAEALPTDVSDSAARLFDDLIPATPIPKKQLRSSLKGDEIPRSVFSRTQSTIARTPIQRTTRSESARPIMSNDGTVNGAVILTPAKRRRGRPRIKSKGDGLSALSERTTTSPSPSRPGTRVKRRRIETPESAPSQHAEPPDAPVHSDDKHPSPNGVHQKEDENISYPSCVPSGFVDDGAPSLRLETTSPMSELDTRSSLAQSQPPENEIKSEDADTPLTGITSRHSVPSDDTLFVAEIANGVGRKDSGDSGMARATHSPISQTTERESASQDLVHPIGSAMNDLDQYSDMDAEGEPDDEVG